MQAEPTQPPLAKAECERYLRGLNCYKRENRDTTLRQISGLSPEHLMQLMREGARLYSKRYRLSTCVELVLLVASLPIALLLFVSFEMSIRMSGLPFFLVVFLAVGWHFCTVPWRMYRALVGILEHTEDLKLIGPAISMYIRPDGPLRTRIALGKTLCRLLPQLRSSHAALFTGSQKQDLLRLLSIGASTDNADEKSVIVSVTLQTLKALEQIGDESAIPAVQNLASPILNQNMMVRQAASECLEYLRLNAGKQREMQTLLRASAATTAAPDTLLRPASGSMDTAPEQLLRPQA